MRPESIIQCVRAKRYHHDARIAAITGVREIYKPTFFRDKQSGHEYFHISGSLAFPNQRNPGFAIIAAVLMEPERKNHPRIQVLAEIEDNDLMGLLSQCEEIRWKYGYPKTIDLWIGDVEMYLEAIAAFNDDIEATPDDRQQGLFFSPPFDHEDSKRRDAIYLETLRRLLTPGPNGKRLLIGSHPKLRNHMENVPSDTREVEFLPPLAALAWCCHTVLSEKPWIEFVKPQGYEPTHNDFESVGLHPNREGSNDRPVFWDEAVWGEDEDQYDDGAMISTVPD